MYPRAYDAFLRDSEGEGEKTPRNTFSPTVAFDMGPAVLDERIASASNLDQARTGSGGRQAASVGFGAERRMEVVTEELLDETAAGSMNLDESLEKAFSPASEGSSSSSGRKEGRAGEEERSEGSVDSPSSCTLVGGAGKASSLDDSRSDTTSYKGSENRGNILRQKSEDAQSYSSNLTPSEERSMEDAGSSMKESEMSTPKGSFASSNDQISTDSGAESAAPSSVATLTSDILEKLFVPLKVLTCHGDSAATSAGRPNMLAALPFWQQEADMSEHIAMKYSLRPLALSTILANDRRRLSEMRQPHAVNCQLLELLQELDGQGHKGAGGCGGSGGDSSAAQGEASRGSATKSVEPSCSSYSYSCPSSSSSSSAAKVMQPPSIKQSKYALDAHKKWIGASAVAAPPRDNSPHQSEPKEGLGRSGSACVERQLLDKLQGMTPGQTSEDWPGDVIMNKVFLSVNLVGNQAAAEAMDRSTQGC